VLKQIKHEHLVDFSHCSAVILTKIFNVSNFVVNINFTVNEMIPFKSHYLIFAVELSVLKSLTVFCKLRAVCVNTPSKDEINVVPNT
jgi:hypothetical protein